MKFDKTFSCPGELSLFVYAHFKAAGCREFETNGIEDEWASNLEQLGLFTEANAQTAQLTERGEIMLAALMVTPLPKQLWTHPNLKDSDQ